MSTNLTVEDLYYLRDDEVKQIVPRTFLDQLKNSYSVKLTFFQNCQAPSRSPIDSEFVDNIACALVCSSIARTSLYNFNRTVDQHRADSYWKTQLENHKAIQASLDLYEWAFPQYCKSDKHSFFQYLVNGQNWGREFKKHLIADNFINNEINKLIAGQANWLEKLNLCFYKLYRLDASLVDEVVRVWQNAFPDKAITVNWQNRNFIQPVKFKDDQFIREVIEAIEVKSITPPHTIFLPGIIDPTPVPHIQQTETRGAQVVELLKGKPKNLGFTTGTQPDNFTIKIQHPMSAPVPSGCFVRGTPILLANGEEIPIEKVSQQHQVIAKNGIISQHTDEQVIVDVESDTFIYGFNEYEPFFSAGHPFWTQDSWKSLRPEVANEENPSRSFTQLDVGDTVYQISSLNPFTYKQVKIEKITYKEIKAGSELYGLHLDGEPSYHVYNFCVAMNYPMITQKRLQDGFAKLTEAERQLIAKSLAPIMPLLKKAVGEFVEKTFQKILSNSFRAN